MQTFIDTVLDDLLERRQNLSETIFVVPSRRSGNVLQATLSRKRNHTSFAPIIYSVEEFISHLSGLRTLSSTELLFEFYKVYLKVEAQDSKDDFATFIGWAQTLIQDFNEMDRYLIPHAPFFSYISELQKLNQWGNEKTPLVTEFLKFWNKLPDFYKAFAENLLAKNTGYQGLLYKKAADEVNFYIENNNNPHVFLGFNALNTAEQHIIQELLAAGNTQIFWDADTNILKNEYHEAGLFMRAYRSEWKYYSNHPFAYELDIFNQPKTIKSYALSQNIGQAKCVGQLLAQIPKEKQHNTAVILGDESLLSVLLNALPASISKVNITMGVPLKDAPVASLFELLFSLHKNENKQGLYFKSVLSILDQPSVKRLLGVTQVIALQKHIRSNNLVHIQIDEILKVTDPKLVTITELLFSSWKNNPSIAVRNCVAIISQLKDILSATETLFLEYLYGLFKVFNQLQRLLEETVYVKEITTLLHFYKDIISTTTLDLRGDPEQGLQIMGMLESRVLDFETVILTGVNEGTLPQGKSQNSFIPYELKKEYKLPTYKEKDAVYAYHFYRLLHRAKNIHLLYTTGGEAVGAIEQSRFITQLELDSLHTVERVQIAPKLQLKAANDLIVIKTPEIISKLSELAQKGFSPSALSVYMRNPLLFYYQYVLGIRENEDVEETIAANTMGTIVHNTLEALYTPFINKTLTVDLLKALLPQIEDEVHRQYTSSYGTLQTIQGKNLIIYTVICRYIENYIQQEISLLTQGDTVIVRSLEDDLNISLNDTTRLRGKVDLVEERNGLLRIIDYKTGKVEQKDLRLSHWEDLTLPEGKHEKAFQVLMYTYMMYKTTSLSFPVQAGILSFKNLKSGFLPFTWVKDNEITEETLVAFEAVLKQLIAEIINPDIPFKEHEVI